MAIAFRKQATASAYCRVPSHRSLPRLLRAAALAGVDGDGLTEADDGLVELSLFQQGAAEVVVGHGIASIDRHCLAIAGNRLPVLALFLEGIAKIAPDAGAVRPQRQCRPELPDRL